MRKPIWLIIVIMLLLTGCKSEALQTEDFVITPVPTKTPLTNRPEVTDEITTILRAEMADTLLEDAYVATDMGDGTTNDILSLYLVSSGAFATTEVQLDSGEVLKFDLVYAYQLNHARQVIVVPVAIGMETADGNYTYFSESHVSDLVAGRATGITRAKALSEAEATLPVGKVFIIGISHLKNRKVDWSHCPDDYYAIIDGQYCQAAQQIDYGNMDLVVQRAATRLPDDWFLVGWFFNAASHFEIVDL